MHKKLPAQQAVGTLLPSNDRTARYAAWCLFVLLFLVCIGLQFVRGGASSGEGDSMRQLSYIAIFGATMLLVRRSRWFAGIPLSVIIVFAWCWLSVSWAIEPGIALRRIGLMTLITLTIFATIEVAGTKRSLAAISAFLLFALALNYAMVVISPVGIHQPGESTDFALAGNWRGATNHKNFAGAISAVTVMVLLFGPRQLPKLLHWGAIAAAGYFLWRTQSKTSIALLGGALVVALLFCMLHPRARKFILPGGIVVLGATWLLFREEIIAPIDAMLSQPDAFTGRAEIWAALIRYASDNWLLGAGYGSFWGIGARSPINDIVSSWVSELLSGHNGYLDITAQIGVPGLVLALLAMVFVPMVRLTASKVPTGFGALLLAMLIFCIGHNLFESSLMTSYSFVGVAFVLVASLAAKRHREMLAEVAQPADPIRPARGEALSFGQ